MLLLCQSPGSGAGDQGWVTPSITHVTCGADPRLKPWYPVLIVVGKAGVGGTVQGFPEEVNEVFQSPKPAGRAYVADGYQCAEIIPKAELCAKISLLLWGLQASPSAWSVGRKRLGGLGGETQEDTCG